MYYYNYYLGKNLLFNHLPSVVTFNSQNIMKANLGATSTYIKESHAHYLQNLLQLKNGPRAVLPNNDTIKVSEQGSLILNANLKPTILIYRKLNSESLLSDGQLCNDDCVAFFDKNKLHVFKQDKLVLEGNRNRIDGL